MSRLLTGNAMAHKRGDRFRPTLAVEYLTEEHRPKVEIRRLMLGRVHLNRTAIRRPSSRIQEGVRQKSGSNSMVESQPSKLLVASSILVSRSKVSTTCKELSFPPLLRLLH